MSTKETEALYQLLVDRMRQMGSVLVAYSGGTDSSLVLAAAHDALGEKALAVTACSQTYPEHEKDQAVALAKQLGARHLLVDSHEIDDAAYCANPPNRCYYCKRELLTQLRAIADREGLALLVDGSNKDDQKDFRPGRQAIEEHKVRSPLAELGLGKAQIRLMARARGLPNWDQPACACLASRIPYGEPITPARLERIGKAEAAIRDLGFRVVRLRDHGNLARIELAKDEIDRAMQSGTRQLLLSACKQQGYAYVCLDLEGYRTGSMNEVLDLSSQKS